MHELAPVLEACRHGRDDTFLYDMCKRADMRWDNTQLHGLDPCARTPCTLFLVPLIHLMLYLCVCLVTNLNFYLRKRELLQYLTHVYFWL